MTTSSNIKNWKVLVKNVEANPQKIKGKPAYKTVGSEIPIHISGLVPSGIRIWVHIGERRRKYHYDNHHGTMSYTLLSKYTCWAKFSWEPARSNIHYVTIRLVNCFCNKPKLFLALQFCFGIEQLCAIGPWLSRQRTHVRGIKSSKAYIIRCPAVSRAILWRTSVQDCPLMCRWLP